MKTSENQSVRLNEWMDDVFASAEEADLSPAEMIACFEIMKSQIIDGCMEAGNEPKERTYEQN